MNRIEKLKAVLRPLDTSGMSTADLAVLCTREVPGCAADEIVEALRSTAFEHRQEANALEARSPIMTKAMDDKTMDHLKAVLDQFSHDEERHFAECPPEMRDKHIWNSLFALRQWVGGEYVRNPSAPIYRDPFGGSM